MINKDNIEFTRYHADNEQESNINQWDEKQKPTMIIAAFPGMGKTYFSQHTNIKTLDSDSSLFSWLEPGIRNPNFPSNYIQHIKENIGKVDVIFVSTHQEVREALVDNGLLFILAYPERSSKESYIQRYIQRGSSPKFVEMMVENWDKFITQLEQQGNCLNITIPETHFLGEYIDEFVGLSQVYKAID
jgi:hypothetical protein